MSRKNKLCVHFYRTAQLQSYVVARCKCKAMIMYKVYVQQKINSFKNIYKAGNGRNARVKKFKTMQQLNIGKQNQQEHNVILGTSIN